MIGQIFAALGLVMFYIITGFGPGIIAGFLLANSIGGRDFERQHHRIEKAARQAGEHNAQWNPEHERWQR